MFIEKLGASLRERSAEGAAGAVWPARARGDHENPNVDYDEDFGYRLARTPEDNHAAWRLRYRVYCEETGYLPKDENLNGFEFDEHDSHANQSLLIHRGSGLLAGTVRLIMPQSDHPGNLPAFQASTALSALPESVLPRATTAEISRFSVDPLFRRRMTDGLYPQQAQVVASGLDPRIAVPKMILGLVVSLIDMVIEGDITHVCAVIDPALLRLLRRCGMQFIHVGAPVEFHGLRQPVYAQTANLIAALCARYPQATSHLF